MEPAQFPSPQLKAALKLKGFKVSRSYVPNSAPTAFGRRHFYKIVLSFGSGRIHFSDRILELEGATLFFANPRVPFAVEILSQQQSGYSCVFTEAFIKPVARLESLQQSPLLNTNADVAFSLNGEQQSKLTGIFESMLAEEASEYQYRDDLMRNYIQLILHEVLRLEPAGQLTTSGNASQRITTQFLELLERQFPIDNMQAPIKLKSAQDFADRLSIHANYLNRAVKEMTGKSTTTVIAERLVAEATALLQYTDWSIADIAYTLGFEYPNYFSNFFKKATGHIPRFYRASKV